jgi:hypothetical protein
VDPAAQKLPVAGDLLVQINELEGIAFHDILPDDSWCASHVPLSAGRFGIMSVARTLVLF